MSIEIITNNAFHFGVNLQEWNFSAAFSSNEAFRNIVSGARYQVAPITGTSPIGYRYLHDSSASYPWSVTGARVVITNVASLVDTVNVSCGVGNLSTGISAESTPTASSSRVGSASRDFIHVADSITLGSDDYGFVRITGLTSGRSIHQVYLSSPFSFNHLSGIPIRRETFFDWVGRYQCDEQIDLEFVGATKAEYNILLQLPKLIEEPFFLYDSTAGYLYEKLIHVVATDLPTLQEFDGRYSVRLRCYRLHQRV